MDTFTHYVYKHHPYKDTPTLAKQKMFNSYYPDMGEDTEGQTYPGIYYIQWYVMISQLIMNWFWFWLNTIESTASPCYIVDTIEMMTLTIEVV